MVEIVYLVEKGRIPESVFERLVSELERSDSNLVLVPLDLALAQTLRHISRADVPEMPDRIIAATALHLGLPLVTKDHEIHAADITTIW